MKLSWKMIITTLLIVAASVSISSFSMINVSFNSELDNQIDSAISDSELLSLILGTIVVKSTESNLLADPALIVSDLIAEEEYLGKYDFRVFDDSGGLLYDSLPNYTGHLSVKSLESKKINYCITRGNGFGDDNSYFIETIERISVNNVGLYVSRVRDVTMVYDLRDGNIRTFYIVMSVSMVCSFIAITLTSSVFTNPIRRLSRTSRSMAEGQYDRRVNLRTHDELGALGDDFNKMADALEKKIDELSNAAKRQRDFTASFSHELKTPLTSVMGYADTLRSRALPPEKQFEAANYIFHESKRLEAMSRALLALFSLEDTKPTFKKIGASSLSSAVSESSSFMLEKKSIALTLSVEDAFVTAEPELIKTLLYNLIDNARKAVEPGGMIILRGEVDSSSGYVFSVADNGRGIPAEELSHITDPFYMVDKSRSRAEGGAGIGLALCRKIAEVHGSSLRFTSKVGVGTVVSFSLEVSE